MDLACYRCGRSPGTGSWGVVTVDGVNRGACPIHHADWHRGLVGVDVAQGTLWGEPAAMDAGPIPALDRGAPGAIGGVVVRAGP